MSIQNSPYVLLPVRQGNGLGTAGFVISLIGLLVTGGLLCPVGLLLSLIALGRQPRGLAIAGVIVGLIGTCGGLLIALAFGAVILAALGVGVAAVFVALADPDKTELTVDMGQIAVAIEKQRDRDGYLPASLSTLGLEPNVLTDPWGSAYEYVLTSESAKPGFELVSPGPDRQTGTSDDLLFSKLDEYWGNFFDIKQHGTGKSGTMDIKVGNRTIHMTGDEQGGVVEIDLGDRIMRLKGKQHGPGTVTIVPKSQATPAPESQGGPATPPAPGTPGSTPPSAPPASPKPVEPPPPGSSPP